MFLPRSLQASKLRGEPTTTKSQHQTAKASKHLDERELKSNALTTSTEHAGREKSQDESSDFLATSLEEHVFPKLSDPHHPEATAGKARESQQTEPDVSSAELDDDQNAGYVKVHSVEQRACLPGEPSCVICGRFGEYICDTTDSDVCSLECKAVDLERASRPPEEVASALKSIFDTESGYRDVSNSHPLSLESFEQDIDWSSFYKDELTEAQANEIRSRLSIQIIGDKVPSPILDFEQCNLPKLLLENMFHAGYEFPTPIQAQVIPAALSGRNILANAHTGSGKTMSFLIPIITKICHIRQSTGESKLLGVILSPTRELCMQIEDETKLVCKGLPLKTALVVGGAPLPQQSYRMQQKIQLVVATPGRLIHLLALHQSPLDQVKVLVLDEVDVMVQMGFREQVMQIVLALSNPQILCFSATLPSSVHNFTDTLLKNPVYIALGDSHAISPNAKQTVIWVENKKKKQKLVDILQSHHFNPPTIVFVECKAGADMLRDYVSSLTTFSASSIHGDKPMSERKEIMHDFIAGKLSILFSTALLGRGLNLITAMQIIMFDMPTTVDEYIHCVGRLGRHGSSCIAFINDDDKMIFRDFVSLLRSSGAVVPQELKNSPFLHSEYALLSVASSRKRKYR